MENKENGAWPEKKVPPCDQAVEEEILSRKGCAQLDPARGCVPRSGVCSADCPGFNGQKNPGGCGGNIC